MVGYKFVTYAHPNERLRAANRQSVASFIATHHRNRSAPSSRSTMTKRQSNQTQRLLPRHDSTIHDEAMQEIPRDGHGVQFDPFAVMPSSYAADVFPAIDYYIHVYGPTHHIGPEAISSEEKGRLIVQQVRDAMQSSILFESMIALALANLTLMTPSSLDMERTALVHYSLAISLIRKSISQGDTGDVVLISIISIIGVNYLQGNLAAFQINLQGLRQIIALRGGLSAFGSTSLICVSAMALESFWAYLSLQKSPVRPVLTPAMSAGTRTTPHVNHEILLKRLPPGFRGLFQEGYLSTKVASLLVSEAQSTQQLIFAPPAKHIHSNSVRKFADLKSKNQDVITIGSHIQTCEELARLLSSPDLTQLDYVCCIGMFINALCVARTEQLSPIYHVQLQYHANELLEHDLNTLEAASRNLHAWTILQVASTMTPDHGIDELYTKADRRLDLAVTLVKAYPHHTWADMKTLMHDFICSETCITVFENVWNLGKLQLRRELTY